MRRVLRCWRRAVLMGWMLAMPALAVAAVAKPEPYADELDRYSKVSMVFAGQDIRSLSAQFGHTYLVFHNDDLPEFNAITFEFTVDLPTTVSYLQTLTGSVSGRYRIKYLANKQRDTDLVARSSWVYTLDLSAAERARLRQAIESRLGNTPPYSIFVSNCASQVIAPVAEAKGLAYQNQDPFFTTPEQTIRWLRDHQLITRTHFLPSLQQRNQHLDGGEEPLDDPSSFSRAQQVALGQDARGVTTLSYRPGFVAGDNEALYAFHDAVSQVLALRIRHQARAWRLDRLDLVDLQSYLPAVSPQEPFTQRLSLRYVDDGAVLPGQPRQVAAEFGRGWTVGSNEAHVSVLPLLSAKALWVDGRSGLEPRLALRAHAFVDRGLAGSRVVLNGDVYASAVRGERSRTQLQWQHALVGGVGLSLDWQRVVRRGVSGNQAGLSLYSDF